MIEVLVALAILVFGMTAVLGLLTFGAALSRTALLRTSAAAASHAVVADLEETMFPRRGRRTLRRARSIRRRTRPARRST
jgi:hypothetical protein